MSSTAMMAAAEADGVYLSGSGYRDISTQIYLREQHCGSSEYAIWEMPSGDCSPPVARPGYSMHEQGLAIDFVVGDDLIRSRGTTAFDWLSRNAARLRLLQPAQRAVALVDDGQLTGRAAVRGVLAPAGGAERARVAAPTGRALGPLVDT